MKNIYYYWISIGIFFMGCKPTRHYLSEVRVGYYRMADTLSVAADTDIERFILPYRRELEAEMNQVVATTARELPHFQPISPLGIWAAEAIHQQANLHSGRKIDITCFGHNGLRIKYFPNGNITRGKIFELMPFDNYIAIVEADSNVIQQLLDLAAFKGGWPIAGATYEIKDKKAVRIRVQGEALQAGKIYHLATSDYMAMGGDNAHFLKTVRREILPQLMRDAFIEAARAATQRGALLDPMLDERIKIYSN